MKFLKKLVGVILVIKITNVNTEIKTKKNYPNKTKNGAQIIENITKLCSIIIINLLVVEWLIFITLPKEEPKKKKIEFELSTDFIVEMWEKQNGKCALTQIEFLIPQERTGGKASPFAPSIDRIDSSKGYEKDNVRLVCVAVNYALNEFGEEIFKQICKAYLKANE